MDLEIATFSEAGDLAGSADDPAGFDLDPTEQKLEGNVATVAIEEGDQPANPCVPAARM